MSSPDRRAAARRRAWGRGPMILRFEPLEGRTLLSGTGSDPSAQAQVMSDLFTSTFNQSSSNIGSNSAAGIQPYMVTSTSNVLATNSGSTAGLLPDLVASSLDTPHNLDWGDTFHARGTITNQGTGATTGSFTVDIYLTGGQDPVKLGSFDVTNPLAPGQSQSFDQELSLPPAPVVGVADGSTVGITLRVDTAVDAQGQDVPGGKIVESNEANNSGLGQGYDTSIVTITPRPSPNLIGTTFKVQPNLARWGGTITVSGTIQNASQGNAPATRALVKLTPLGTLPGGSADATIASIDIPALAAWQTYTLPAKAITLPDSAPTSLGQATKFVVTMVQDADSTAKPFGPHQATQGLGKDASLIQITPAPTSATGSNGSGTTTPTPAPPLPDLSVPDVQVATTNLVWGQPFDVTTTVQNQGQAATGTLRLRVLLANPDNTSLNLPVPLSDMIIPGLQPGESQTYHPVVTLSGKVPDNLPINAANQVKVMVLVDPENVVSESNESNNANTSAPVTLKFTPDPAPLVLPQVESTPAPASSSSTSTPQAQNPTPTPSTSTPQNQGTTSDSGQSSSQSTTNTQTSSSSTATGQVASNATPSSSSPAQSASTSSSPSASDTSQASNGETVQYVTLRNGQRIALRRRLTRVQPTLRTRQALVRPALAQGNGSQAAASLPRQARTFFPWLRQNPGRLRVFPRQTNPSNQQS